MKEDLKQMQKELAEVRAANIGDMVRGPPSPILPATPQPVSPTSPPPFEPLLAESLFAPPSHTLASESLSFFDRRAIADSFKRQAEDLTAGLRFAAVTDYTALQLMDARLPRYGMLDAREPRSFVRQLLTQLVTVHQDSARDLFFSKMDELSQARINEAESRKYTLTELIAAFLQFHVTEHRLFSNWRDWIRVDNVPYSSTAAVRYCQEFTRRTELVSDLLQDPHKLQVYHFIAGFPKGDIQDKLLERYISGDGLSKLAPKDWYFKVVQDAYDRIRKKTSMSSATKPFVTSSQETAPAANRNRGRYGGARYGKPARDGGSETEPARSQPPNPVKEQHTYAGQKEAPLSSPNPKRNPPPPPTPIASSSSGGSGDQFQGKCKTCHQKGHKQKDCPSKKRPSDEAEGGKRKHFRKD